jgi:predicted O-linked N-acetylglucosamine transferase (SPINDLY family)
LAGDFEAACVAFEALLQLNPLDVDGWLMLGAARHRMSKLDAARDAFLRAAVLDPQNVQSRFALAAVCLALGDAKAAVAACVEAADLDPDAPDAWFSLAVAHEASGSKEAAFDAYGRALQLAPDHVGALKNQRALLIAIGRVAEVVAQCRAVAARQPFSVEAQFNLGESLTEVQDFVEATRAFGRAANLSPGNARVALHYGFALAQIERFDEAQKQLDHAASIAPALVHEYRKTIFGEAQGDLAAVPPRLDARVLFLLHHFDRIERCDWTGRDRFVRCFSAMIEKNNGPPLSERALGFRALAMGLDPALQLRLARQIAAGVADLLPGSVQAPCFSTKNSTRHARIRVGYISAGFCRHPVALLLGEMFSWHDRTRFEVIAYSVGDDDSSEERRNIAASCDQFVDLVGVDDDVAARRIAADSIDVLIDLMGCLDRARSGILARRPAPIQVSWMAALATTGASWIDYVVADAVSLPPDLACHFSEAAIRLPVGIYFCPYANRQLPAPSHRSSVGLPDDAIVLGAMHNHYKIDPKVFAVWMRLLAAHKKAVLWLLDGYAEVKAVLCASALQYGIAPERLIFAPKVRHDEHLARLQWVDLSLDTPQCNGGTTTADALAAGVPVLTCAGSTLVQRVAASLINAAGIDDLITYDLAQYEARARDLLLTPGCLERVRAQIAEARATAPFFFPKKWLGYFETGILRAWDHHLAGLLPVDFDVPDEADAELESA